jgi:hypothetical protein
VVTIALDLIPLATVDLFVPMATIELPELQGSADEVTLNGQSVTWQGDPEVTW